MEVITMTEEHKQKGRPRSEDRRVVSNYIDSKLYDELHRISQESRISKARLLDKSIELLIEHYNEHNGAVKFNK